MKEFKDPPPNYTPIKFEDASSPVRALESLPEKPVWNHAHSREGNLDLFTDLMIPYPMALCPYCSRVIPAKYFPTGDGADKCPFPDCGKVLHAPYNSSQESVQDSDDDGIPDKEETRLGLNPQDGTDAAADNDDDGFSNYEEYIHKTDLKNPLKRPPYHEKLFVRSIVRAKLPFRLKNVSFSGGRDKTKAQIQMEIDRVRRKGTARTQDKFMKINSLFQSLSGQFKVIDVIPKFTKKSSGIEENESTVVVQKVDTGEKIELQIGKVTYEPRVKAVLEINLVNDSKEINVFENSKFKIGKLKTGEDSYTVVKIDQKNNTVSIKFDADGKIYTIGPVSIMQQKIDAVRKSSGPRRPRKTGKKT